MKTYEVLRKETFTYSIEVEVDDDANEEDAIEAAMDFGDEEWDKPEPGDYEIEYEAELIE